MQLALYLYKYLCKWHTSYIKRKVYLALRWYALCVDSISGLSNNRIWKHDDLDTGVFLCIFGVLF